MLRSAPVFFMELTAEDYWRLAKVYPQSDFEREGEPLYIAMQRQKKQMRLHLARERGYGDIKPLWNAILQCRRAGFTLQDTACILETDIDTIENEWDILLQNAQ